MVWCLQRHDPTTQAAQQTVEAPQRDRSWASSLMWQPWCNVQIPTTQKIPKLWRNPTFRSGAECASVMQRHVARYSAGQEVPQIQFVDEVVDVPVVTERQVPTDQNVQKKVEMFQVRFIDKVVHDLTIMEEQVSPVQVAWKTVEEPQLQKTFRDVDIPGEQTNAETPQMQDMDRVPDILVTTHRVSLVLHLALKTAANHGGRRSRRSSRYMKSKGRAPVRRTVFEMMVSQGIRRDNGVVTGNIRKKAARIDGERTTCLTRCIRMVGWW